MAASDIWSSCCHPQTASLLITMDTMWGSFIYSLMGHLYNKWVFFSKRLRQMQLISYHYPYTCSWSTFKTFNKQTVYFSRWSLTKSGILNGVLNPLFLIFNETFSKMHLFEVLMLFFINLSKPSDVNLCLWMKAVMNYQLISKVTLMLFHRPK